jgi:release factor glutamine methyltransferase
VIAVRELLALGAAALVDPDARREAELLLGHALQRDRAWLFAHASEPVAQVERDRFLALIERRARGEPVAYLTGSRAFWTLDLAVSSAVLVPRPETELLVEAALERLASDRELRIADLGTGSGAIALALASERPAAQVVATDASAAALDVARGNALRHRIGNVEFRLGSWWNPLAQERFDLIASNPPYVATGDPHVSRGDLRFEPPLALTSGADGLDAIRAIAGGAMRHLRPGGWLLLEHGLDQGETVRAILAEAGLRQATTLQDIEARDRVTLAQAPER